MSKKKRKKQKRKNRELVVVNVNGGRSSGDAGPLIAGLLGQALVAGAVYGFAQAIAAEPRRRSLARFALRHPAASLELAGMAAQDARQKLVARWRHWLAGSGPEAGRDGQSRLSYRTPDVER